MYNNRVLRGILSKRDLELLERDTYNMMEYGKEMSNEWCYGDERIDEIHSEWDSLSNGYILEDYNKKYI